MRYTVGQWVWVESTVGARYRERRRVVEMREAGWPAVVVGATRIKLGSVNPGSPACLERAPEPPSFTVKRTVLAYLVRRGVTNKAHRALSQHLRPIAPQELPWFYNSDPGGHRGFERWKAELDAMVVETVLGERCRYCGDARYLQPRQRPPNAPAGHRKPCPACNPRGERPVGA